MKINKDLREYINSIPISTDEYNTKFTVSTLIDILFYGTVDYRTMSNIGKKLIGEDKSLSEIIYYMGNPYGITFKFHKGQLNIYGNNSNDEIDYDIEEIPLNSVKKFLNDNKTHIKESLKVLHEMNSKFNMHNRTRFNPSDIKQTITSGDMSITVSLLGIYKVIFKGVDVTTNPMFMENSEFIFENIPVTYELIPEFDGICEISMNPPVK